MSEVVLEVLGADGWVRAGGVGEAEPPGSVSDDGPFGRNVIIFGWMGGAPGVWFSEAGIDVETDAVRELHTVGLVQLSDLAQPFEMDRGMAERRIKVRWRLEP